MWLPFMHHFTFKSSKSETIASKKIEQIVQSLVQDFTTTMEGSYSSPMKNSSITNNNLRPPNVGTGNNMSDELCTIGRLDRNNVVAWTSLDPNLEETVGHVTCCQSFGFFLVCPCFWPHLLILWPCLLAGKISAENTIRNMYWVLTTTELKVIVMSYSGCCGRVGETIKSIPLDTITDCGLSAPNTGCGSCYTGIPTIYVDTASSGGRRSSDAGNTIGSSHEAIGCGLSGYDWFITEIIARRNTLKGHNNNLQQAIVVMDRGNGESTESRLRTIKDLHNRGILNDTEYEKKRQDIISSI